MKVALAQTNQTIGDIPRNVAKIIDYGKKAINLGAEMVIFPELAICGYPPKDLLLKESFVKSNLEGLSQVAAGLKGIACVVGFVDFNKGSGRRLFNACAYIKDGQIQAVQYKTLLPTYDVFDEGRYFEPASEYALPLLANKKFGLSICEDIWNDKDIWPQQPYRIDPIEQLVQLSPDVLINISASPFAAGKEHIRHELVRHQALKHKLPVLYVNQVGGNDELIFDGRSIVVNSDGKLIARAKAFEEDLLVVDLDTMTGTIAESPEDKVANTLEALELGVRDYMLKCGFKKAVIGLSGGIDSAVTAAIACSAIGKENILGVAMPSPYSSGHSVEDARQLAKNLDIEFEIIRIEEPMQAFTNILDPHFAGTKPDVTEENIQARLRGITLMALSNKFGYLVLTTGNKSELAVGYCTLYGDMCGGLAVISDLPKMMVYSVARYINERAGKELIPESTISKPPSAELRPGQLDQDSLPPYVVLDGILQAYVEERRSIEDIIALGYKPEVVQDVINKVDHNEYKRYQAAPGLKVTAQAFGSGWRMPIAQRYKETLKTVSGK